MALKWLRHLRFPTREQVTKAWVSLVCTLLWLPGRMLHVFLGTYLSRNDKVRKAGLVADINALALTVAVLLLLTSRATFNTAEETIKHQAWAYLLLDSPGAACASLNQQPFSGSIAQGIQFRCTSNGNTRWSWPVDARDTTQVLAVLHALDSCKMFSMGMLFQGSFSPIENELCFHTAAATDGSMSGIINSVIGSISMFRDSGTKKRHSAGRLDLGETGRHLAGW